MSKCTLIELKCNFIHYCKLTYNSNYYLKQLF